MESKIAYLQMIQVHITNSKQRKHPPRRPCR